MKKTTMRENLQLSQELEITAQKAADILLEFDRLPENPDKSLLKQKIAEQLQNEGLITITIFSCLDWLPEKLSSKKPEEFIGDTIRDQDLFIPRVSKLRQIREKLLLNGIASKLVVILGDTDLEEYFDLILKQNNIHLNRDILKQREESYVSSFISRSQEKLLPPTEVITWSEIQTLYNDVLADIPEEMLTQEAQTMKENYLSGRNFSNLKFEIPEQVFLKAAKRKITLYAKQGKAVEDFGGGVLLQTETPWLLRTQMLKLSCANILTIYPWIRQEEMESL